MLKSLLKQYDMSVSQLSKKSGVSQTTIRKILKGEKPQTKTWNRILKCFK